ncbi:MAG: hypothetical protein HZA59_06740 [Hydrogenophilales bacterium]|nr:hypothetical protein [Hydrogenophilales bacterium]
MRIPFVLSVLLTTALILGCDSKPAKPPTPKIDAAPAAGTAAPAAGTAAPPAKAAEPHE